MGNPKKGKGKAAPASSGSSKKKGKKKAATAAGEGPQRQRQRAHGCGGRRPLRPCRLAARCHARPLHVQQPAGTSCSVGSNSSGCVLHADCLDPRCMHLRHIHLHARASPGLDNVEDGEELQYDPTAYDCMHVMSLDWPCLRHVPHLLICMRFQ